MILSIRSSEDMKFTMVLTALALNLFEGELVQCFGNHFVGEWKAVCWKRDT